MADQTALSLSASTFNYNELVVSVRDREILRDLGKRMVEIAASPEQIEKRRLWYSHNSLEATRPVIFCDPENGWSEIILEETLKCSGEMTRQWEMFLRKEIFWGESMGDDRVVEPVFPVGYVYSESDWGMHEIKIKGDKQGSYRWDAPLSDYKFMDRMRFPEITVNHDATGKVFNAAHEVFGDILKVVIKGSWWWTLGMTMTLVYLRGLEQVMLDMYDFPDELHKIMAFLRDGHLAKLDFLEEKGLLSLNNEGTYVGSGGFGYTNELPKKDFSGKVRTIDMWGFGESQETSQISPDMFREFIFPYQLPILERFGLNCYGCCEPLNKRWDDIARIPRLRRVSVSPWSDMSDMAEKLGAKYIFSMKPNPAYLAIPEIDEQYIRKELREAMKITQGCRVEVIMKDNHTLGNNPQNAIRWCKIAREEAER